MRSVNGFFRFLLLIFGLMAGLASVQAETHRVRSGESLYSIAKDYEVSLDALMTRNGIRDARQVRVGQVLQIPRQMSERPSFPPVPAKEGDSIYVVKKGDTLSKVAREHELPVSRLKEWNALTSEELKVGQRLKVERRAEVIAPPTPAPKPVEAPPADRYLFLDRVKHLIDLPKIQQGRWRYIVVHHSATPSGNASIFDLAHRQRGMENGLAYHFLIGNGNDSGDGQVEVGGRWLKQLQGGHLKSEELNQIAIGICFVGNFNETRPTKRQLAAAIELIAYLRQRIREPIPIFKGHREINPKPTECPGRNFPLEALHRLFD